jgi:hypothetical protein
LARLGEIRAKGAMCEICPHETHKVLSRLLDETTVRHAEMRCALRYLYM